MHESISSPSDLFSLSAVDGKITIEATPDLAQELIYGLSVLLDLSRAIRAKVIHARAYAAAKDEQDIKRRQLEFKARSSEIFARFQEHMNNGCAGDKAKALQCIKQDFSLAYGEAKIYVIEGRRLYKASKATVGKSSRRAALGLKTKPLLGKEVVS